MSLYITISIEFIFIENFEYQILPYASEYQKNKFLSRNNIRWIVSPKVFFIAYWQRLAIMAWVMNNSPAEMLFYLTTPREICVEDKEFVLKAMKLDPKDRPSAQELLGGKWFN